MKDLGIPDILRSPLIKPPCLRQMSHYVVHFIISVREELVDLAKINT